MKNKKFAVILIVICFAMVTFLTLKIGMSLANAQTIPISNVFADVNGDGKLDLIVNANVILNQGQENFLVSQKNP